MLNQENLDEVIAEDELKVALAAVFKRAQTDLEFRSLCLENPAEAIFQVSGKRLPAGATMSFTESADG